MENVTYSKNNIEEMLNILNTFNIVGFDSVHKMARIFNILNNPVTQVDTNTKVNEDK